MAASDWRYTTVARWALPQFGLSADAALTPLAWGHNHVFRVDDAGAAFVLRLQSVDRLTDAAQLLQLKWLDSLRREAGLSVPGPIRTLSGEWFLHATGAAGDEARRCVLLTWVDGEPLSSPEAFVTGDVLERVGAAVARQHLYSSGFGCGHDGGAKELDAERLVGSKSCLGDGSAEQMIRSVDFAILTEAASRIETAMTRARQLGGQYGLIHADLAPANWVFHEGEPRPIDFDEFGRGFFLFDLLGVLWSHVSWEHYPRFRNHLLAGYERVRPLPAVVKDAADLFQAATLFAWFNHGCRLSDSAARAEFLKWVPSTARAVAKLCMP